MTSAELLFLRCGLDCLDIAEVDRATIDSMHVEAGARVACTDVQLAREMIDARSCLRRFSRRDTRVIWRE